MAKVVISFEDAADGINFKMKSDPPLPNPMNPAAAEQPITLAQRMGLKMFEIVMEEFKKDHMGDTEIKPNATVPANEPLETIKTICPGELLEPREPKP